MKRRIKVFLIVLFNLILITELVMPTKIYAATNSNVKTNSLNGWVKEYDNYYYYQNDVKLRGWQKLDGNWYFFDESGAMATGWLVNDGKIYYLDEFGVMQTGWMTIEGERYFFSVTGAMQRGFTSISETTYYFDREGRMKIGWQEIDGNKFYFDNTGAMLTGSQEINGYSYVFNYDGVLISEPKTLNTSLNANIEDNVGAIEWTFDSSLLSQWRNTDFPISIYISDATTARCNGEQMSLKGNHEFVYYAPENGEYTIEYENESGKTSLAGTITVRNIDKTPVRFTDFSDDISIEVNSFPYRINITDQADHDGVSCVAQNGISVTIDGTPLTNFGYATYSDGTGYIDCPRAGHYEFTIVDAAGNTARLHATLSLATSNNDNVPPAIYVVEAPSNEWSNQDKLVKFTVTDNVAVDTVSIQTSAESKVLARHADGTYSCYLQGNGVYTLVAKDTNGNQSTLDVNCQKIDKVPPSFSNVQDGKTYSNTSAFPVLYSDNASGIAGTPVVTRNGENYTNFTGNDTSIMLSEEGEYTIQIADVAGNTALVSFTLTDQQIGDPPMMAPTITVDPIPTTWTNSQTTVTFTVTQGTNDVETVKVNNTTLALKSDGKYSFYTTQNGAYAIEVTDRIGLKDTKTINIENIDKVPPSITGAENGGAYTENITLSVQDALSGIRTFLVTKDGRTVDAQLDASGHVTLSETGAYVVTATDNAGNTNEISFTIETPAVEDTEGPEITFSLGITSFITGHSDIVIHWTIR